MKSLYEINVLENTNKFTFYDAKGNETKEELVYDKNNLSETFFNDTIESIQNELSDVMIFKDIKMKKYMICKHKTSGFYKLRFLVLTEHNFLHFFELMNLEKKFPKFSNLIKKLNEIPSNKFTSFLLSTTDDLTKEEEISLRELNELINKNLSDFPVSRQYSLYLADKKTRINRNKIELSIYEKNKNQILGLFPTKIIKIKGYIVNDLYELLYFLEEKIERSNNKEIQDNKSEVKMDYDLEKGISYVNLEEENPWNE